LKNNLYLKKLKLKFMA